MSKLKVFMPCDTLQAGIKYNPRSQFCKQGICPDDMWEQCLELRKSEEIEKAAEAQQRRDNQAPDAMSKRLEKPALVTRVMMLIVDRERMMTGEEIADELAEEGYALKIDIMNAQATDTHKSLWMLKQAGRLHGFENITEPKMRTNTGGYVALAKAVTLETPTTNELANACSDAGVKVPSPGTLSMIINDLGKTIAYLRKQEKM